MANKKTNVVINGIAYYQEWVKLRAGKKLVRGRSYNEWRKKRDKAIADDAVGIVPASDTLGKAFLDWLDKVWRRQKNGDASYIKHEQTYLHNMACDILMGLVFTEVRSIDVQGFVDRKRAEGRSRTQIRMALTLLKMFYRFAAEERYVLVDPCRTVTSDDTDEDGEDDAGEIVVYSDEEMSALLDHFTGTKYEFFFNLLARTGMRCGEALALEYADIDGSVIHITKTIKKKRVKRGRYTITSGKPKTANSVRDLPFRGKLRDSFVAHRLEKMKRNLREGRGAIKPSDPVFTGRSGERLASSTIRYQLRTACEKTGVEYRSPHTFRHTYITKLAQSGKVDAPTLMKLAGHGSIKTTMRYFHAEMSHKDGTVDIIDARF
jgi:integrase